MKRIEHYRGIVEDHVLADLHRRASKLFDRQVTHVNSTAYGGGVAELLGSVVPLMNDAGVNTQWRVLVGDNDFFSVTKKFHNALQGGEINLTPEKCSVYELTNEAFSQYTHFGDQNAIIIHDPQPLPLITYYRKRQPWIWRCHIDQSTPNPELWEYLKGFLLRYDLIVVSHESYLHANLPIRQVVVHPAIDPLAQKNVDLTAEKIAGFLTKEGVPLDKPLICQVSRFDQWKDPLGVIEAFRRIRTESDCRLVMAGNSASDDPESDSVLMQVEEQAADLIESGDVILLLGANDITINALQRASAVAIQKSTREGFGLTVSESMWKGTPVVASAVGGIPLQLSDGEGGFLVEPSDIDGVAERVLRLLQDPAYARKVGASGRERVRRDFLVTRLVGHWLSLVREVIEETGC